MPWVTSTTAPASAPNSAFAPDIINKGTTNLVTPLITLPFEGGLLTFQNLYNMEATESTGLDGMVLEISINGGGFADILSAGGSFVSGGYTHTISTSFGSQIAGRHGLEWPFRRNPRRTELYYNNYYSTIRSQRTDHSIEVACSHRHSWSG